MLINSAKYCTVNQFIECKYENNLSVLGTGTPDELKVAWQQISLEFITLIGIDVPTATLEINIANTTSRINAMKTWVFIQRDSMQRFGFPLPELFHEFHKYGHKINYTGNDNDLLLQLETIENKERQYNMLLTKDKKRLENIRIAQGDESEQDDSRPHFIKLLNALRESVGFQIDRDKMTVEELAILIAEKKAAAKAAKSN
jgi:hypothetical protein